MALDRLSNFDQKWQSKKNKGFRSANNQSVEHIENETFGPRNEFQFSTLGGVLVRNLNFHFRAKNASEFQRENSQIQKTNVEHKNRFPLYFQNSPRMRLSGFWIIGKLPVSVPNVRKSN